MIQCENRPAEEGEQGGIEFWFGKSIERSKKTALDVVMVLKAQINSLIEMFRLAAL